MTIIQNIFWTFLGYKKNNNKAVKQTTFYFPPLPRFLTYRLSGEGMIYFLKNAPAGGDIF